MKKARFLALFLLFALLMPSLAACTSSGDDVVLKGNIPTYRVMITVSDGITVLSEPSVEVEKGENVSFRLQFAENYTFASADAGIYDAATGTLTLPNVDKATMITVTAEKLDYDTSKEVEYIFHASAATDTTSVPDGKKIKLGTTITVTAGNTSKHFSGWSFGKSGEIVSTERTYTFRVTPEIAAGDVMEVRPHYSSLNVLYYDANGGTVNADSTNAKSSKHATVSISGSRITINLSTTYLSKLSCATAFWNDGTFTRDGYVLREYNTKADGTGMTVLPGDKVYQVNPDGGDFVLYCIWEKADVSMFEYDLYTMPLPKGIKSANAPEWHTDGIIITGYKGDAKTLAIPETIDGKPVIALKKGAIKNANFTALYLPRTMQEVQDGAVTGCSSMTRLYFPSGIWSMKDEAFDDRTYSKWREFYVYASIAPRYSNAEQGSYGRKLSRILSADGRNRIISIAGSSTLQGLGTEYLEALLDHEYLVVNFGTTRTTHGSLYLEAMQNFAHEGDIVIFAPENSIYMMGDTELYWKTIRDMESLYQLFRYVDISEYSNIFDAFCEQNQGYAYKRAPRTYEDAADFTGMNEYGDDVKKNKNGYVNSSSTKYIEAYNISLNNRFKSTSEGQWEDAGFQNDFNHDTYWVSIDESPYLDQINRVVNLVKKTGAKVYFGFAPTDEAAMFTEAKSTAWLDAYDNLMRTKFAFDGTLGSCKTFIYAHEYFYDCAFHTNNYGRTWHTFNMYKALCELLGKTAKYENGALGTDFDQCLFETDSGGRISTSPKYPTGISG